MLIQVTLLGDTSCLITIKQLHYSVFNRSLHKYRNKFCKMINFHQWQIFTSPAPFRPTWSPFHALADSCHSCDHSEFPDGGRFCLCCFTPCSVHLLHWETFHSCSQLQCQRAPRLCAWGFDKLNLLNRRKGLFLTSSVLISVLSKKSAALLARAAHWRGWRIGESCCLATHDNLWESYFTVGTEKAHPCL